MTTANIIEILKKKFTISERIQLVEDLWETIAETPGEVELTDWEKKILDERLESHLANPEAGSSWEEAKSRILKMQ